MTNNFTNTGDEQRFFGNDSTSGGWGNDQATARTSDEPRCSEGGGSPEWAQATEAWANEIIADGIISLSNPQELVGLERTREGQSVPQANNCAENGKDRRPQSQILSRQTMQEWARNEGSLRDNYANGKYTQANDGNEAVREESTQQNTPPPQCTRKRPRRGAVKIAMLNIRGAGSEINSYKWGEISGLMAQEKIDILTVQETHLDEKSTQRQTKSMRRGYTSFQHWTR